MALLLLKAINNYPYSKYYKGDVVEVRDDDAEICKEEKLPTFLWIKVAGTAEKLRYYMDSLYDGISTPDSNQGTVIRKRKYRFPIDTNYTKAELDSKELQSVQTIDTFNKTSIDQMVP